MGLLNRLSIGSNGKADKYTTLRNDIDAGKHNSFNSQMDAEVISKIRALPKNKQAQACKDLGIDPSLI